MKRACMYILIIAAVTGCNKYMINESVSKAEATLHYADSLERTTRPYADTATLQKK